MARNIRIKLGTIAAMAMSMRFCGGRTRKENHALEFGIFPDEFEMEATCGVRVAPSCRAHFYLGLCSFYLICCNCIVV